MKRLISNKVMLAAVILKGVTGALGTAGVLEQNHPYFTLGILSVYAGVNELILYTERNKNSEV